jgi:hypothetical protein
MIVRNNLLNPRLIGDHLFGDPVDSHRLRADGPIGTHQMAHGIGDLPVDNIDRGDFNDAPCRPQVSVSMTRSMARSRAKQ